MYISLPENHPEFARITEIMTLRGHTITTFMEDAEGIVFDAEDKNPRNLPVIIVRDFTVPQAVPQKSCLIDISTGEVVNYNSVKKVVV